MIALKSFISPARFSISWLSSSVERLGWSLCNSSDECVTDDAFVKRFDAPNDGFLYGDVLWGRSVTVGSDFYLEFVWFCDLCWNSPFVGQVIIGVDAAELPGIPKLMRGWPLISVATATLYGNDGLEGKRVYCLVTLFIVF